MVVVAAVVEKAVILVVVVLGTSSRMPNLQCFVPISPSFLSTVFWKHFM